VGVARTAPDALRARAAALAGRYDELAEAAGAAAVRWRWATPTSGRGDVEPLRLERMGRTPGRWLRHAPAGREHETIGFDAADRVVCVRQHDATGEVWLARFAAWEDEAVELACFRAPVGALAAQLQAVTRVRLSAGVPVASERFLPPTGSRVRERYVHRDGRLASVEEHDDRSGTVVKEILYGADGEVEAVDAVGAGGRETVWRRAAPAGGPAAPAPVTLNGAQPS
jgi:hypothetical protein